MKVHTVFSLRVMDSPGFQYQSSHSQGVSFHNIYINYLSERLNELFQHKTIISPREQYLQVCVSAYCSYYLFHNFLYLIYNETRSCLL